VDGFEFIDGSHACQFQGVIAVGLAFDVASLPGIFVGRADERLEPQADGQVVDPSGRPAGLHDNQVDRARLEDGRQVVAVGRRGRELIFACFRVEKGSTLS